MTHDVTMTSWKPALQLSRTRPYLQHPMSLSLHVRLLEMVGTSLLALRPTQTCRADAVLIVPGPLSVWQSLDQGEHLEPLEKMGQLNANKTSKTSQNMKFLN